MRFSAWIASLDRVLERVKVRYMGLGLLLAWVYCTWFSDAVFGEANPGDAGSTLRFSLLFSAVALLALAFRPNKRTPLGMRWTIAASVCVTVTTFAFLLSPSGAMLYVLASAGGFASSILWVQWGELYCQIDEDLMESSITASLGVFIVAALLVFFLPSAVAGVLDCLFPLASGLLLMLCKNRQPKEYVFPLLKERARGSSAAMVGLALCSMACSIATGFTTVSIATLSSWFSGDALVVAYVCGAMMAVVMLTITLAHASRIDFSSMYEWAVPLIVCSLSLQVIGGFQANTLSIVLACSAAFYVEVLFFAVFSKITRRGLFAPSETFGIFRALVQLGFLLGGWLGSRLAPQGTAGTTVCLAFICIVVSMIPLYLHLQKRFEYPVLPEKGDLESAATSTFAREDQVFASIVQDFRLSPRESEVISYLGRGRSVPYIREALVISKSTIETHIKHIYSKTGVHSKQELLDLVERYRDNRDLSGESETGPRP